MRGLIYTRVSTDEQAEHGFSLAAQEELCRERAMLDQCSSIDLFADEGYSASSLERPALQRLLQTIRRGDTIYVYRLDRLSRDVEHMAVLLKRFQSKQIRISPIIGSADVSTSLGRAFTNMQAVWAQLEREQLGERVSMGMRKRVADGKPYSRVPYGLRSNDGSWMIDESESQVVSKAFELRASGHGIATICKRFAQDGFQTRQNRLWNGRAIWHVLKNPAYVGDLVYKDIKQVGVIPAIITRDLWDAVQVVNQVRQKSRTRTESRYLLSGLVFCECGLSMGGYVQRTYKRKDGTYLSYLMYRCIGRASTPATDHNNVVTMRKLDELVLRHLVERSDSGSVSIALPISSKKRDDSKLSDLLQQLENLETVLLQGRISGERYDLHKERIEREIEGAKRDIARTQDENQSWLSMRETIRKHLPPHLVESYLEYGSTPHLKSAVQAFIERIEVSRPDGQRQGLDSRFIRIQLRPIE